MKPLKNISLNRCPHCAGEGKIWDFENPEEPAFYYCEVCKGENIFSN